MLKSAKRSPDGPSWNKNQVVCIDYLSKQKKKIHYEVCLEGQKYNKQ
jgi:hypothetical protein